MVQNGIFWTIGEKSYFVYYPIISYKRVKVYRVEIMDMRRYHWNNGVSGTVVATIPRMTPISKYFAVKYHWFRQHVGKEFVLRKIKSENQKRQIFSPKVYKVKYL